MLCPTSDPANKESLLWRTLAALFPSLRQRGLDASVRLSLVQSLSLGKECHLLLVLCGEQHYLIGRGKASVDSIVPIDAGQPAVAHSRSWQSITCGRGADV